MELTNEIGLLAINYSLMFCNQYWIIKTRDSVFGGALITCIIMLMIYNLIVIGRINILHIKHALHTRKLKKNHQKYIHEKISVINKFQLE